MRDVKTPGERLREKRLEKKLSTRKVADQIGVSATLISLYERDKRTPSVLKAIDIADLYGCSVYELFCYGERRTE